MPKRKTLPKNFEAILTKGTAAQQRAVFDNCDLNARGGIWNAPALAFDPCPDALARWLVAQGADLEAKAKDGGTALHHRSRSRTGRLRVLVELGADIQAKSKDGPPLHWAVASFNVKNAKVLLGRGADVNAKDPRGRTALEDALASCNNADIESMAELSRVLLKGGAKKTPRMKGIVHIIGRRFEEYRDAFNPEFLPSTDKALHELYKVYDVEPVPRRAKHDGKSPIKAKAKTWQKQFAELWELLVPGSGPAHTVQGEVIRISGRIAREMLDNGGVNWDADYRKMSAALLEHLESATPIEPSDATAVRDIIRAIRRRTDDVLELSRVAVSWVLANPRPMKLPRTAYRR